MYLITQAQGLDEPLSMAESLGNRLPKLVGDVGGAQHSAERGRRSVSSVSSVGASKRLMSNHRSTCSR